MQDFANMETADLARLLGVRVTRAISGGNGYMVRKVIQDGDVIAELRPSRLRGYLIDIASEFEAGGAFA